MQNQDKRSVVRCKAVLAALLLLGAALLAGGLWGSGQHDASSFSQENAYSLIYSLSNEISALWEKGIQPALQASSADTAKIVSLCRSLTQSCWPEKEWQLLEEKSGSLSGDALTQREMKLLAASFSLSGPKIKSASRKK